MFKRSSRVERVTGMQDVLPEEYVKRRRLYSIIAKVFEQFGYRGIDVPSIESMELHLRKSGEAIRKHMYYFKDLGLESVSLRPEFTASVVRVFNDKMQDRPLPQKLYYFGSSFRYDKPQAGRYREFTQAGVELIGGAKPEHDAEIIALACKVMEALGIIDYELVIGNIGITLELLSQKKIEERAKSYIVWALEDLSKAENIDTGISKIRDGLENIGLSLDDITSEDSEKLAYIKELPDANAEKIIEWVVRTVYEDVGGERSLAEITKNLYSKIKREGQGRHIAEALDFISKLTQIKGNPPDVFSEVENLIQEHNLDAKPVEELRQISNYLECHGINWNNVKIDFGFGRGLQYYTGMIFEIYVDSDKLGRSQKQVCGGGRYDSLIGDLGGVKPIPALGFSFGFERLLLCSPDNNVPAYSLDVFVAPVGGDKELSYAIQTITALRSADLKAELGSTGNSFKKHTKTANKLNAKYALFIGSDELANKYLTLKNMDTGEQDKYSIDEAIKKITFGEDLL